MAYEENLSKPVVPYYRQKTFLWVVAIVIAATIFVLAAFYFDWIWTGFIRYATRNTTTLTAPNGDVTTTETLVQIPGKTLWDILELAIIPGALFGGGYLLNRAQKRNEQDIAKDRHEEAALQSYLDQMTNLLLKEDLRRSEPNSEVRSIARARTLTVLRGLNTDRKSVVLNFLYEAELIKTDDLIIDLRKADLQNLSLPNADLVGSHLTGTNLRNAFLCNAHLARANLTRVNLSGANLVDADLRETNLKGANLSQADLSYATFSNWQPDGKRLKEANLQSIDLHKANLFSAELNEANLEGADLREANLQKCSLAGANLSGVDLKGANLIGAELNKVKLRDVEIDDKTRLDDKWRLVWEIVNQVQPNRNLKGKDLSYADLSLTQLEQANLSGADLSRANLRYAKLNQAVLSDVQLNNADLSNAHLIGATLTNAKLIEADLTQVDFSFADLSGADFSFADLSGANLHSALNWQKANFSSVQEDDDTEWPIGFDKQKANVIYKD